MKNKILALASAAAVLITLSAVSVSAARGKITHIQPEYIRVTTTVAEATTEEETEATTKAVASKTVRSGRTTKKELASAATTEATTAAEKATETTTTEIPTDEQGKALEGAELRAYNVVKNTYKDKWTAITNPKPIVSTVYNDADMNIMAKSFTFDDGNKFTIKRYTFNSDVTSATTVEESTRATTAEGTSSAESTETTTAELYERYTEELVIPGDTLELRYLQIDTNEWYMSGNPENSAKQTLYIDTDRAHYIVSVPAVYSNVFDNGTLEANPDLERKITITKTDEGYALSYSFPKSKSYIGEIWYLASEKPLADWNKSNHFEALKQDLAINRRLSWDGYYFPTPSNYTPYSPTMFYRQPSDYAGSSFAKYGDFPAAFDMGYVMTYLCMQNQNEDGYWATAPKSGWLATDFNIGAGFYDTRFNTDFGENLLYAYKRYNNDEFLQAAARYCEFFTEHAQNNHYDTKSGGWLVEDYGYKYAHNRTHVSLNHQLAELNFLYKVYQITKEDRYRELADKMLLAVEDTQDQWVLANNNLNYALYYLGETNTMVDYPYLTYNDLKHTKELYKAIYNKEVSTIEYLMKCKMEWMLANNVTGYEK